ncbi:hypothetical protein Pmani_038197 [Petrolisthes manimaculis]|uniref:Uncharacterized protein n=1 Tax=Petrolisthes manimaculis TaxID=1843537 RepID=A0AAE1NHL2_9EUCA|nr:hypothetical protein Pmani_038197 [Petrolisthes manimaculis]
MAGVRRRVVESKSRVPPPTLPDTNDHDRWQGLGTDWSSTRLRNAPRTRDPTTALHRGLPWTDGRAVRTCCQCLP